MLYTEKFGGSSAVMSLSNYAGLLHTGFSINGKILSKQKIRQRIETPALQNSILSQLNFRKSF